MNEGPQSHLKKKEEYVSTKVNEIEKAHEEQKSRLAWKTVNEVTKRKHCNSGRLEASNPSERVAVWKGHFSSLLGTAASAPSEDHHPRGATY